uniref:Coat protein n=1 Tax=Mesocestoides corti TaxID=53468 RepID=A0A5K3G140_MESCO
SINAGSSGDDKSVDTSIPSPAHFSGDSQSRRSTSTAASVNTVFGVVGSSSARVLFPELTAVPLVV